MTVAELVREFNRKKRAGARARPVMILTPKAKHFLGVPCTCGECFVDPRLQYGEAA